MAKKKVDSSVTDKAKVGLEEDRFDPETGDYYCGRCGTKMVRCGTCRKCFNCGNSSGCS